MSDHDVPTLDRIDIGAICLIVACFLTAVIVGLS